MSVAPGRRALTLLYVLSFSLVAAVLILLGYVLERVPLLPPALAAGYRRAMFAALAGLARPVDGLTDGVPEPVAAGVTRESPR